MPYQLGIESLKQKKIEKTINNYAQQSIKIIAEIAVNMNTVARIKFSSKLKKSTSAIGYYSYTNRCASAGKKQTKE